MHDLTYPEALARQAQHLERSRESVTAALQATDLRPWRAGTLGLVGMGASFTALQAAAPTLRAAGRAAFALSAGELADGAPLPPLDALVAVSLSGRSRETVSALRAYQGRPRLLLTAEPTAAAAREVEAAVSLGIAEDSRVSTDGYTATLQALGLLAEALGAGALSPSWERLPGLIEVPRPDIPMLAATLASLRAFDTVGSGVHLAAAGETALILREACRVPAAAYETFQYLHGPMESLEAGMGLIVFGDGREVDLALDAVRTGAEVLLVTAAEVGDVAGLTVIPIARSQGLGRAILEIVPLQHLAWGMCLERGLDAQGFRYQQADTRIAE